MNGSRQPLDEDRPTSTTATATATAVLEAGDGSERGVASTSPPVDDKVAMRRRIGALRNALAPEQRAARSRLATERLISELDRPEIDVVMAFVSIRSEIDSADLLRWVLASGRRLVLPRTVANIVDPVETADLRLVPGAFGVLEPPGPPIEPHTIAAVVAPGLAFDRDGRRLGYGAGCYDRFLPRLRLGTPVIGWCFAEQIVERVPTDAHDLTMSVIVSDKGVEFDGRAAV